MQCPRCTTPMYNGSEVCSRCGYPLSVAPLARPGWQAVELPPGPKPVEETGGNSHLTTGQYLLMLLAGLLPLVGVFYSLGNAFGGGNHPARKSLAKAILWLHGGVLCLALVVLCVWVLALATQVGW